MTSAMLTRSNHPFRQYHAHVYFDAATLAQARALCAQAGRELMVVVGRVHERRSGPTRAGAASSPSTKSSSRR